MKNLVLVSWLALSIVACGGKTPGSSTGCSADKDCDCKNCYCDSQGVGGSHTCKVTSEPTCTPPGTVSCPSGTSLVASPTGSGCIAPGYTPANGIPPPYDNPPGTCASVGDVVVKCA